MQNIIYKTHILLIASVVAVAVIGSEALAQSKNIGFVNISIIMQKAPQAKRAKNKLEEEFSEKDDELSRMESKVNRLRDQLEDQTKKLSASKKSKLRRDIASAQRKLRARKEEFRELFSDRRREELSKLQELVYEVVIKMAKSKKMDLIVTEPVLYASDRINLTEDVLKALKKRAK